MTYFLYDLLYMLPVCLMAVISCGELLQIPEGSPWGPVLAVIIVILTDGVRRAGKRLKILLVGIPAVFFVGVCTVLIIIGKAELLTENIWVLWVFLAAEASFAAGLLLTRGFAVRRIASVLLTVAAVLVMTGNLEADKAVVALYFFLMLLFLVEEVQKSWKKGGNTDGRKHLVNISPFILIILLLVYKIPAPEEPYDWELFIKVWDKMVTGIKKLTSELFYHEDEYAVMGFTDENSIAGNISSEDPREIMVLGGFGYHENKVYLGGKIFDTFNGREWTADFSEEGHRRMMDTLETQCAVRKYDPKFMNDYLYSAEIDISYRMHNTKFIFLPLKSLISGNEVSGILFNEKSDSVESEDTLGYDASYNYRYYCLNMRSSLFNDMLVNHDKITEEDWNENIVNARLDGNPEYSYPEYLKYREEIQENYTQEITLSAELRSVLDELFDGTQSDLERLRCLEQYLGEFEYSTNPGVLPDSVDSLEQFLDYLILDKKEGYCIHYATAFSLIARAMGLPTRFVQGYYVPRIGSESTVVTSAMAHAWPEVYIEDIGWIGFEPTPGHKIDEGWVLSNRSDVVNEGAFPHKLPSQEEDDNKSSLQEEEKQSVGVVIILIPFGLLIVFLIAYIYISALVSHIHYKKLDTSGKTAELCRKSIKLLSGMERKLLPGETLAEYRTELIKAGIPESALSNIVIFEELSYRSGEVSPETLENAEKSYEILLGVLKRRSRFGYVMYTLGGRR